MSDQHEQYPLYFKRQPTGLRLDLRGGSVRHIGSAYLQALVSPDERICDLYFATAVIHIEGTGLGAIVAALEDDEHPLGRLAGISERMPPTALGETEPKVRIASIEIDDKLDPFPADVTPERGEAQP